MNFLQGVFVLGTRTPGEGSSPEFISKVLGYELLIIDHFYYQIENFEMPVFSSCESESEWFDSGPRRMPEDLGFLLNDQAAKLKRRL